jgi:hypothetical protein
MENQFTTLWKNLYALNCAVGRREKTAYEISTLCKGPWAILAFCGATLFTHCLLWFVQNPMDLFFFSSLKTFFLFGSVFLMAWYALYATFTDFRCGLNLEAMVDELVLLTNENNISSTIEDKEEVKPETEEMKLARYKEELEKEWLVLDGLIKDFPLKESISLSKKFPEPFTPKGGNLDRLAIKGYTFHGPATPIICKTKSSSSCVLF